MTNLEELFPYEKQREELEYLLDVEKMYAEDNVAEWIKDFSMEFEKRLLKQLNTNKMSKEDLVGIFISLFAFVIHYTKETGKSINMDKDTLDKFYLIMEHYNPKVINPVTQEDYKNQIDEINVILSKIINEKVTELGLDDESGEEYHYHES